jgi:hypothetical protein
MIPWLSPASRATVAVVVSASPCFATERIVASINCSRRSAGGAVRRRLMLLQGSWLFRMNPLKSTS